MNEVNAFTYAQMAKKWAAQRWCWSDESFIDELIADWGTETRPSPITLIDEAAEHYGLLDPYEPYVGSFYTPEQQKELADLRARIERVWNATREDNHAAQ